MNKISKEQIFLMQREMWAFNECMFENLCEQLDIDCLEDIDASKFDSAMKCIKELYNWRDNCEDTASSKD